jgi:hypothetical protein
MTDLESALIAKLRAPDSTPRDPRELLRQFGESEKPVLLVDEGRDDSGLPFVWFSLVLLPGSMVRDALRDVALACMRHPRAAGLTARRLLREEGPDTAELKEVLTHWLGNAADLIRVGITQESLREWRLQHAWTSGPSIPNGIEHHRVEFAVLQHLAVNVVRFFSLDGLVVMVADRADQNGLDEKTSRLSPGEIGATGFDLTDGSVLIIGATPEDGTFGPLTRLPDLDAALAFASPQFSDFADLARRNPTPGGLTYWTPRTGSMK